MLVYTESGNTKRNVSDILHSWTLVQLASQQLDFPLEIVNQ